MITTTDADRGPRDTVSRRGRLRAKRLTRDTLLRLSTTARIQRGPVIVGDVLTRRPVLDDRGLDHPVAFLGTTNIVPLIQQMGTGQTAGSVVRQWSGTLTEERSWVILSWLWDRKVVVESTDRLAPINEQETRNLYEYQSF